MFTLFLGNTIASVFINMSTFKLIQMSHWWTVCRRHGPSPQSCLQCRHQCLLQNEPSPFCCHQHEEIAAMLKGHYYMLSPFARDPMHCFSGVSTLHITHKIQLQFVVLCSEWTAGEEERHIHTLNTASAWQQPCLECNNPQACQCTM